MVLPPADWNSQVRSLELRLRAAEVTANNQRLVFEARVRREALEVMRLQSVLNGYLVAPGPLPRPTGSPPVRISYAILPLLSYRI